MKEKFQWSVLLTGLTIGIAIGFLFFSVSTNETNTPTINCNCPEFECPEYNQEEVINNCIKVLNDAETIKNLVNN